MQRALFRPTMLLLGRGCVTRGRSTTVRRPSKKVETPRRSLLRVGAKKSSFAHHRVGVALKRAVKPSAAPRRRGRPPKNATAKKASTRVAKTKRTRRMKRQAKMKHDASAAVASVCVEPSVESASAAERCDTTDGAVYESKEVLYTDTPAAIDDVATASCADGALGAEPCASAPSAAMPTSADDSVEHGPRADCRAEDASSSTDWRPF